MEKTKYDSGVTTSCLGDVIYLTFCAVITIVAVTGIVHHPDQWGIYVLLWIAAVESYTARVVTTVFRKRWEQRNG